MRIRLEKLDKDLFFSTCFKARTNKLYIYFRQCTYNIFFLDFLLLYFTDYNKHAKISPRTVLHLQKIIYIRD
jgi:hypothetical protein